MDRRVYRRRDSRDTIHGEEPPPQEKLLKYFPGEALALYFTLDPLVREAFLGDGQKLGLWASLILAVVFCWLFLRRFWNIESQLQLAISSGTLVLYVAAIGGPFATLDSYKPIYGVIAAVVATAFMIFVPSEELPAPPSR